MTLHCDTHRADHDIDPLPTDAATPECEQANDHRHPDRDRGQATTEYALILLGAAAIAVLVITWATAGGGAGRIGDLFDTVLDAIISQA